MVVGTGGRGSSKCVEARRDSGDPGGGVRGKRRAVDTKRVVGGSIGVERDDDEDGVCSNTEAGSRAVRVGMAYDSQTGLNSASLWVTTSDQTRAAAINCKLYTPKWQFTAISDSDLHKPSRENPCTTSQGSAHTHTHTPPTNHRRYPTFKPTISNLKSTAMYLCF